MADAALISAIATVPPGAWAVGVSGGADSVALLLLLSARSDLTLHVLHLDHETRAGESAKDAAFVRELAQRLNLPHHIALRSQIEARMHDLPANTSSRYRAARLALFRKIVEQEKLRGVILAHHADDQAETVLHRLLRGSGPPGLAAMETGTEIGGLKILRPLVSIHRDALRAYLLERQQSWREDASNASDDYLRNRLRRLLKKETDLSDVLLQLGDVCAQWRSWIRSAARSLPPAFEAAQLADQPSMLATESARAWLVARGVPPDMTSPAVIARLLKLAADAASVPKAQFPCGVTVRRKSGMIRSQHDV